jgi:hypothetical protein
MRALLAGLAIGIAATVFTVGCASTDSGGAAPAAKQEKCKVCGTTADCKDGCCAKCAEKKKA